MRIAIALAVVMMLASTHASQASDFSASGRIDTGGQNPPDVVDEYVLDDGTGENSIGLTAGGTFTYVNQFTVIAGAETITNVRIAGGTIPMGSPTIIVIWDDPNNDGDPTDITPGDLLFALPGLTGPEDSDIFTDYAVPGVNVGSAGDSFFLGACTSQAPGTFPARIDQSSINGRSWAAGDGSTVFDCTNPSAGSVAWLNIDTIPGLEGNWMVRGDAGGAVPVEPGTWGSVKAVYR